MTPAAEAKHLGLKSLQTAVDMTSENRSYFERLHKRRPKVFKAVIIGLHMQLIHKDIIDQRKKLNDRLFDPFERGERGER